MRLKSEPKPHIAVVGSADIELTMSLPRLPTPGDTLFADPIESRPGGRATNICSALSRLGCRVFLFTNVGLDAHGAGVLADLSKQRINVDYVERSDDPTGIIHIFRDTAGAKFRVVAPGAGRNMSRNPLINGKAMISSCQLLVLLADVSEDVFGFSIDIAHHFDVPVLAIPAPADRVRPSLLSKADIVLAGVSESEALTKSRPETLSTAEEALNIFLKLGPGAAIIYLGRFGAACSSKLNESMFFPAPQSNSPIAPEAEEIFTAALSYCLCAEYPLAEACTFAVSAVNLVNSRAAEPFAYPSLQQISASNNLRFS